MKPFRRAGRGQKALLDGREDHKSLLESWEGLGGLGESGDLQEGRRVQESLPERQEGSGG